MQYMKDVNETLERNLKKTNKGILQKFQNCLSHSILGISLPCVWERLLNNKNSRALLKFSLSCSVTFLIFHDASDNRRMC